MPGRFRACVGEQCIHDKARGMQTRLVLEQRRQGGGRAILRYNWVILAAIWILQLTDPSNLDRDHVFQLINQLGIKDEVTRQLPFTQRLSPEPDPTYTAHHP
eukprot:1609061-Pyramimonas_sp.AAC.1